MDEELVESKVTGILENWFVQRYASLGEYVIWGEIHFDEKGRFFDNTMIHTSGISEFDYNPKILKKGDIVRTRNSVYVLGEPKELSPDQIDFLK